MADAWMCRRFTSAPLSVGQVPKGQHPYLFELRSHDSKPICEPNSTMTDPEKADTQPETQLRGSCACGRLTYACSSLPAANDTTACHCVNCRKLSGGPYQAYADVASKSVTFFDNEEHLRYEGLPKDNMGGIVFVRLSAAGERAYCGSCYSPLAMRYKNEPGVTGLTLGSVDEGSIVDSRVRSALSLKAHIFTSQKAWWFELKDGIPVHERFSGCGKES